ncbi:hypothetical protein OAL29_01195 [Candidatus Binatia bacterium]|nr:hypothetical protein [Candidatus Binatia bacterium]
MESVRAACREIGLSSLQIQMRFPGDTVPELEISHGLVDSPSADTAASVVLSMPMDSENLMMGTIAASLPANQHSKSPFLLNRIDQIRRATLLSVRRLRKLEQRKSHLKSPADATNPAKSTTATA